VKKIL